MGYTKEELEAQLAVAKQELADAQEEIERVKIELKKQQAQQDVLNVQIYTLEAQVAPTPPRQEVDKFAQRDESRLEKKRGKYVKETAPDGVVWTL